ncbi:unnamed protein product [Blepharisma stoltei]|uniref:Uncharacterized protein n=1 Tax=Blepharisma stoltei TaxID=1481888 RepID=A0AAU9JD22_9CILI|nr:unnamed protein product [Blepharisma stoltei]
MQQQKATPDYSTFDFTKNTKYRKHRISIVSPAFSKTTSMISLTPKKPLVMPRLKSRGSTRRIKPELSSLFESSTTSSQIWKPFSQFARASFVRPPTGGGFAGMILTRNSKTLEYSNRFKIKQDFY